VRCVKERWSKTDVCAVSIGLHLRSTINRDHVMRPKARTLACLTAAAALNSAFATNGYFTYGIGPQSKAMAGTGVASPGFSGPAIVATNPALGAFLNEGLEVGLGAFNPRRSYRASASAAQGQGGAFTLGEGEVELEFSMRF